MQVILNVEEAHAVLARVTGLVIDDAGLSEGAREAIRRWRAAHRVGERQMDRFAIELNEALGNHIDERTTRMLRLKGGRYISEAEARA